MKPSTAARLTGEGATNMVRGGWMSLASIATVAITLLMLALVALLALNLHHLSTTVQDQLQIIGYFPDDFAEEEGVGAAAAIEALPEVRTAQFVSQDEALAHLREQFGEREHLLDAVEENNPLRHSVEVWAHDAEQIPAIADHLEATTPVEEAVYPSDVVSRLTTLTRALQIGGMVLVGLMLTAAVFIIANTIRMTVHARRREIRIMTMVGATRNFIRWPFLMEGMLLGVVGAGLAAVAVWFGYAWLLEQLARLPWLPVLDSRALLLQLAQILLGVGVLVGLAGSGISLRRYLQV